MALSLAAAAQAPTSGEFGTGCARARSSFFELWTPGSFDLAATGATPAGYAMVQNGRGFYVWPGSATWRAPSPQAVPVVAVSNGLSAPLPLGFRFAFPGGRTDFVWVHEDGFVCFAPTSLFAEILTPVNRMFEGAPCLAAFWSDFELVAGSSVTIERDPAAAFAAITWTAVREVGTNWTSSFQVVLHANGSIDVVLLSCQANSHPSVSGWSPGNGAMTTEPCDLSALAITPVATFPDLEPPRLQTGDVPRIGSTIHMETLRILPQCRLLACAVGAQGFDPGLDLSAFGAPDCLLHSSCDWSVLHLVVDGTTSTPLQVPNDPQMIGGIAWVQSAAFAPLANPLGLVFSNGYQLVVAP